MNASTTLTGTQTRITAALATINRAWPAMQHPPQEAGRRTGRPTSRPPCSEGPLSQRAEVTHDLARWTHALADQIGSNRLWHQNVDCRCVPTMCAVLASHAAWLSGWEHAPQLLSCLETHARELRRTAWPPHRDTLVIGECPLTEDQPGAQPCGGQVRVRRTEDWAVCRTCRTGAVVRWWRERIPTPEAVTGARLVLLLAVDAGIVITESAVRQRHKRGQIRSTGRDNKGRRLYPWREIIDAELAATRA